MNTSYSSRFCSFLLLAAISVSLCQSAFAQTAGAKSATTKQEAPKKPVAKKEGRVFSKKPLVKMWFSVDQQEAGVYMQDLMKEYGFQSRFLSGQLKAGERMAMSKPELQGMMVFMAKGLIPSAVQMTFRSVESEKEFKDAIFAAKKQLGSAATLKGSGDHYSLELDFSQGIPVFGAQEGDEPQMMRFPGMDQIQDNPQAMAGMKQEIHFRLIGNVMWQGNMPEIMEFDFPSSKQLQPKASQKKFEVYGEFNIEEVPGYIKSVLMSTVGLTAQSKLQQRDDEEQLEYDARRANGDLWLQLLRTIVYDINRGRFSVQLAKDDKPIRIRLDLDARSESSMAKVGRLIGDQGTRFGALIDRKAPMTVATSWGMPKQMQKLLNASLALARREWDAEFVGNDEGAAAATRVGELLEETIKAGRTDAAVQLTGDVLTGFAFVGGVRAEKADQLQTALGELLIASGQSVSDSASEGRKYLTINTGELPIPGDEEQQFESGMHLCVQNGCLWFSFGGPSAEALLEDTLVYAAENRRSGAVRADTFRFAFDLSEWMEGDEEVDGFNQYPRQTLLAAERKIDQGLDQMFGMLSGQGRDSMEGLPPRDSFIDKALKRGGDEVDLRVKIDRSGFDLKLDIGLGVANMLVARVIDMQGRVMDAMMSNKTGSFDIPGKQTAPPGEAPSAKEK